MDNLSIIPNCRKIKNVIKKISGATIKRIQYNGCNCSWEPFFLFIESGFEVKQNLALQKFKYKLKPVVAPWNSWSLKTSFYKIFSCTSSTIRSIFQSRMSNDSYLQKLTQRSLWTYVRIVPLAELILCSGTFSALGHAGSMKMKPHDTTMKSFI